MTEEDIAELNAIAYEIIDNMGQDDRMVVRGYDDGGYYPFDYSTDKDWLKTQVENWPWKGGNFYGRNYTPGGNGKVGDKLSALEIFNVATGAVGHDPDKELVVVAFSNSTDIETFYFSTSRKFVTDMNAYIILLTSGDPTTRSMQYLDVVAGGGVIDCQNGVDEKSQAPISKSATEVYEEFYQLYSLRQGLDTDEGQGDGLWDMYESKGFLATNGNIYHCDPTKIDTDGDSVSDGEEAGSREPITIKVEYGGNLYLNGSVVDESNPAYPLFASYGDGTWCIFNLSSNPENPDTDNDLVNDNDDAIPLKENIFVSYCFFDAEHADLGAFWARYESVHYGVFVVSWEVFNHKYFKDFWNSMGKNNEGKYQFRILNIHMNFHASVGRIRFGRSSGEDGYLVSETRYIRNVNDAKNDRPDLSEDEIKKAFEPYYTKVSDLDKKTIFGTLYLDCCQSGRTDFTSLDPLYYSSSGTGTNLAVEFLHTQNFIGSVIAWDGTYGTSLDGDQLYSCTVRKNPDGKNVEIKECVMYYKDSSGNILHYLIAMKDGIVTI